MHGEGVESAEHQERRLMNWRGSTIKNSLSEIKQSMLRGSIYQSIKTSKSKVKTESQLAKCKYISSSIGLKPC